ncbi:hypothetical protein ABFT80_23605 [Mesorhizobium sp. SB112]|uniref:hypothetical protein n=1 Tax=Mesorhizobium sp. SB112 TaxID=3151853 RepID=UPI003267CD7B
MSDRIDNEEMQRRMSQALFRSENGGVKVEVRRSRNLLEIEQSSKVPRIRREADILTYEGPLRHNKQQSASTKSPFVNQHSMLRHSLDKHAESK